MGEEGRRCCKAPPDGRPQPLRLPAARGGHSLAGGTSMSPERWGPKQPVEEPRRRRCSPQHQGPQHRDSCFDNPLVPAPGWPRPTWLPRRVRRRRERGGIPHYFTGVVVHSLSFFGSWRKNKLHFPQSYGTCVTMTDNIKGPGACWEMEFE